ncbi:MAG: hypothetical protein KOO63_16825 [Bacteroidales bacterium]|nr:hypothetical protein [Candidatus Latescibacterota bacterium]
MTRRIITGIIITLVLLAVARRLSMNNSEALLSSSGGVTVTHSTVFEQVGREMPVLTVRVEPADGAHAYLVYRVQGEDMSGRGDQDNDETAGSDNIVKVEMTAGENGTFSGNLPDLEKGNRLGYAFEVEVKDEESGQQERLRLPEIEGSFLTLKYKGEVSTLVLILHVIFMFGAFFFMVESGLCAIPVFKGAEGKEMTAVMMRWLILFTFVGGWPLGFILNYQRFGPIWEGFPFGYDITDNKTQLMLVIWAITVLLSLGSFFGKGEEKDKLGRKGFAIAVLVSTILSFLIFLIPHSL